MVGALPDFNVYRQVKADEVDACFELETASYPDDEAASHDALTYRQREAGSYFFGAFMKAAPKPLQPEPAKDFLIGFVCGTVIEGDTLTHESMSKHNPEGTTLCIHSVVVDALQRRRGIASKLMKRYVTYVLKNQPKISKILLVAKAHLLPFYRQCGFHFQGVSSLAHGKDTWYEMSLDCAEAKRLNVVQVDAFTDVPFKGNPAAVVICETEGDLHSVSADVEKLMQSIATEMNLSETAFVMPIPGKLNEFGLRWFTPALEVDLCGHATLASSKVLYSKNLVAPDSSIKFHTKSGILVASLQNPKEGASSLVSLDFPSFAPKEVSDTSAREEMVQKVCAGLSIDEKDIVKLSMSKFDAVVELNWEAFQNLKPSAAVLKEIACRGIIATTANKQKQETKYDFLSRFFGPNCGVDEDPVTGSAHCVLAPYWAAKLSKNELFACQASARSGELHLSLVENDRVIISGAAVVVMEGIVQLPAESPLFFL